MNYVFGCEPSPVDKRDFVFSAKFEMPEELPSKVDLSKTCNKPEDQSVLGSCVSCAAVEALEFLERKNRKFPLELSKLFVYYNARAIIGNEDLNTGTTIREVMKALKKYGCSTEYYWPYVTDNFRDKPPKIAYNNGSKRKIQAYYTLITLDDMKSCLADGYPFLFGIYVFDNFVSDAVRESGIVSLPDPGESRLGGHCMLCVGYDDETETFKFMNSWGSSWGQKGFGSIPYEYLIQKDLAFEFWSIESAEGI
jgi:C1A family cysteine protease